MCVDRQQLIQVVFSGYADPDGEPARQHRRPVASTGHRAAQVRLRHRATRCSTSSGTRRAPDGVRVAPATTGKYAEPAHKMEYQVMVPNSLDFNGDRTFSIVQEGFANAGVKVTEQSGGDSSAAYAIETDDQCDPATNTGYSKFDIALWDWVASPDPDFQLSVVTKAQWCSWSDTGWDNPAYDKMYEKQGTLVKESDRMDLVHQMDKIIHDNWVYTQLVNEQGIAAYRPQVGGLRRPGARIQLQRVHEPAPEVGDGGQGADNTTRRCNEATTS